MVPSTDYLTLSFVKNKVDVTHHRHRPIYVYVTHANTNTWGFKCQQHRKMPLQWSSPSHATALVVIATRSEMVLLVDPFTLEAQFNYIALHFLPVIPFAYFLIKF